VFGRPAVTENPGFHTERYWIDYKFPGTPLLKVPLSAAR